MPTLTPVNLPIGFGTNPKTVTVTVAVIALLPKLESTETDQPGEPLASTFTPTAKTDLLAFVAGLPEDYRQVDLFTTCIAVAAGIAIFFVIIALAVYLNRLRRRL